MAGDRLSRRDVLGGLVSAAAIGAAARGPALASPLTGEIRRSGGMLRLGSNENATGLGPAARAAFLAAADEANRYPGGVWSTLVDALTSHHRVDRSWIHVTPGSGALLSAATLAYTSASRALVTAPPSFEAPARVAQRTGATVHAVPVTADGRLDLDAMLAKAASAGLIYVCNPNNPTGGGVPGTALTAFAERLKTVAPEARVLVDEAYFEYADEPGYATAVPLAVADPRVFVTRTFSKVFGMAGLRVGYAVGQAETMKALGRYRLAFNVNVLGLAAAIASLKDPAGVARERDRNTEARGYTVQVLRELGCRATDSHTNFVFADIQRPAKQFREACEARGIRVGRDFPPYEKTHVRVSIGTLDEMRRAAAVFRAVLGAPRAS